jgi:PST family polysaccharide transporter
LKKILIKYKNLIENFASLYILKITNIIIPLITLPYLVRILGVDNFGLISFAQVFASFFVMIVDFGFWLSVVRLISIHEKDKEKISEIFSSVIVIKLILLTVSFIVYYLIVYNVEKFSNHSLLYLYMYGIVIGQGLFPNWFFQGMQRMKFITILNVIVKVVFLILIFIMIKKPDDYLNYPILLSLGYIGILPFAFYLIKRDFDVRFFIPSMDKLLYYIKYSSHFFFSRIAVKLYESGGIFVVGLISTDLVVGYYAIADKLRVSITSLYTPISQALYPYIAKERNIKLYKKIFILINLVNIVGLLILFIFTAEILDIIFSEHSMLTVWLLRVFIIAMLLDVPSILMGYPLLGAFGYTNYVNYVIVFSSLIYLFCLMILYLFGILAVKSVAILYVFIIGIGVILRVYGIYKYKIFIEGYSK